MKTPAFRKTRGNKVGGENERKKRKQETLMSSKQGWTAEGGLGN